MGVLKANLEQYNFLNGYQEEGSRLKFIKDANNNWVVGVNILTDNNFIGIRPQLEQLEVIPYNPIIVEI